MRHFRLLCFFYQSIIINRYQFITRLYAAFQSAPVRRLFQIRHNLIKCLSDCYIRIVIHTTVQFPVIHIVNCIIIPFTGFLNTDIAVCQLESKLCFFPARFPDTGIYVWVFPLHKWYIFHDMLLVGCRHEVFHFSLFIEGVKPVHIEGNIIKTAAL